MSIIYLVSCVSKKCTVPTVAKDLYLSSWFRKARHYVEQTGEPWFILSAKHGLVSPNELIAPYEMTLNRMPIKDRREWAARVSSQLAQAVPQANRVVFLAGHRYREFLSVLLTDREICVEVPMQGLAIGKQLRWLDNNHG